MSDEKHNLHRINVDREYYVAQVGRTLEVKDRNTHAVLQVVEPPKEWADNWLWSCCEFDGSRCVAVDRIRLLRINQRGPLTEEIASAGEGGKPRPEFPEPETVRTTRQVAPDTAPLLRGTLAALRGCHDERGGHAHSNQGLDAEGQLSSPDGSSVPDKRASRVGPQPAIRLG